MKQEEHVWIKPIRKGLAECIVSAGAHTVVLLLLTIQCAHENDKINMLK